VQTVVKLAQIQDVFGGTGEAGVLMTAEFGEGLEKIHVAFFLVLEVLDE